MNKRRTHPLTGLNHILSNVFEHLTDTSKRNRVLRESWTFLTIFYRKIANEKILQESATLTYITLLGFIPFLIFVFYLLPSLPFLNFQSKLEDVIFKNFLPNSAVQVSYYIALITEKKVSFNIVSFVVMLIASYSLFKVISGIFDRILRTELEWKADFLNLILRFLGTIIFGFIIILVLFSSTSVPLIYMLVKIEWLKQLLSLILPFFAQFFIILFLYLFMPTIKVKRKSLLRATVITTIFWILAKSLFDFYITNLTSYHAIYGVLALIPIFLFWMYVNWVIILGGMVLLSVLEFRENAILSEKEKSRKVKMTLEFYVDQKLKRRMQTFFENDDLQKLFEAYDKGVEEEENDES